MCNIWNYGRDISNYREYFLYLLDRFVKDEKGLLR
jgi:hypothetical protein